MKGAEIMQNRKQLMKDILINVLKEHYSGVSVPGVKEKKHSKVINYIRITNVIDGEFLNIYIQALRVQKIPIPQVMGERAKCKAILAAYRGE